jgi:hypothetical protein
VFWDAKRPITADLLRRLDLRRLAKEKGCESEFDGCFGDSSAKRIHRPRRNRAATQVQNVLNLHE